MAGKRLAVTLGDFYAQVEALAKEREMSMGEFVREAVHDHINSDRLPKRDDLAWIKHLLAIHHSNASRVGNNLNQIALKMHEIEILDEESLKANLDEMMNVFGELCDQLRESRILLGRV